MLSLAAVTLNLPLPILYKALVDTVLPEKNSMALFASLGLIVGCILSGALFGYWSDVRGANVRRVFSTNLRTTVFAQMQRLPFDKYQQFMSGDLTARLTRDLDSLNILLPFGIVNLLKNAIVSLCLIAVLFYLNWKFTLLSAVIIPFFLIIFTGMQNSLWKIARQTQQKRGNMQAVLQEKVEGLRETRLTNSYLYQESHARDVIDQSESAQADLTIQQAGIQASMVTFQIMGTMVLWGIGGMGIIQGWISLGEIIGFSYAFNFIFGPLSAIFMSVSAIQVELAALERVFHFFPIAPKRDDRYLSDEFKKVTGEVTFTNVSFSYNSERDVLRDIYLTVSPGTVTCIIGPSGSGKTTILHLFTRLFDEYSGVITLDGKDIKEVPPEQVSRAIGLVSQQVFLFHGTIKENIVMGRIVSEAWMQEICSLSGITDLIRRFPHGIDTVVSEKGANLSGGERQKIAIARALVDNPQVLLLDEPTNNLDDEARVRLRQGLMLANHGKTVLVVTHDSKLIEGVERVFELRDGSLSAVENEVVNSVKRGGELNERLKDRIAEGGYGAVFG